MGVSFASGLNVGGVVGVQMHVPGSSDPIAKYRYVVRLQTHKFEKSGVIVVSGAGTSDANGDYAIVGTVNGKLFYSNGVCNIFWSGTQWLIAALSPFMGYYSNGSDTPTPAIDEGWSVSPNGTAPAPIVVPQYKPLGLYQDTDCTVPALVAGDPVEAWKDEFTGSVYIFLFSGSTAPTLQFVDGVPVVRGSSANFTRLVSTPDLIQDTTAPQLIVTRVACYAAGASSVGRVFGYSDNRSVGSFGSGNQWGYYQTATAPDIVDLGSDWSKRSTLSVQLNDDVSGEAWVDGSNHTTFDLRTISAPPLTILGSPVSSADGDMVAFMICLDTAGREYIEAYQLSLWPAVPVIPPADVPTLVTAPVVTADNSGSGGSFGIYTCDGGTWDNADSLNYQWNLDGNPISGAGDAIFGATVYQIGHDLTCTVTAINGGGSSLPSTSNDVSARSLGVAWISVSATPGAGSVDNPNDPFFFAQDAYTALVNGGYPSPNVLFFQAGADGGQLDVNLASSVPRLDVYGSVEGFPSACVCTLSVIAYNSSSVLKLINIQMSGQVSYTNNSGSTASVDGGRIIGTNASIDNLIVAGTDGVDASPGGSGDFTGTDGDPGADGEPPSPGGAGQSADSSGGSTGAGTNGNGAVTLLLISDPHSVFSVSNLSAVGGRGGNGGPGANGATAIGGNGGVGGNWNGLPDGNDHFGADGGPGGDAVSNGGDAGAGGNGGDGATITFQDDISFGTVTVNGGAMGFGGAGSLAGSATPGSGGSPGMGIDAVGLPANPGNNGSNGNASAANGNDAPDGTAGADGSIITI